MLVGIPLEHENSAVEPKECAVEMSDYLVKVAQDRCKASFARVFGFFAPRLRSYALKQLGNEALAMELVQDTMSNVWQKAHLFNAEKGSPSTWIFTIARNIRFDMLRKVQNRKEDICADDLWPSGADAVFARCAQGTRDSSACGQSKGLRPRDLARWDCLGALDL